MTSQPCRFRALPVLALCAAMAGWALSAAPLSAQDPDPGRIVGRVIDGRTSRPLAVAEVIIEEAGVSAVTDPTGQYRSRPLPPGTYTVRLQLLGYAPQAKEVVVRSGEVSTVDFAVEATALEIEGLTVEVQSAEETGSVDALLASQRAAPVVSDGISSEQISRSPDSDASDAIARVPGVSVVDGRFVVVRGLAERYSNTLLNGAEVASTEPTKRVVPLDAFPASLLESVVTSKAATPDKPGNFAGGSVNINTKDFPDERVVEIKVSQGWNDLSGFRRIRAFRPSGLDLLGFDGDGRNLSMEPEQSTEFAESLRSEWSPPVRRVLPNLGLGLTWGDQVGEFERALGYVISANYGQGVEYQPDRYFAFADGSAPVPDLRGVNEFSSWSTNWGVVANASLRFGAANTVSLKNLITRENQESYNSRLGLDTEVQGSQFGNQIRTFQVRYLERTLYQGQLSGRHYFDALLGSTLEWQGSYAKALRDEPENRSINQLFNTNENVWQIDDSEENSYWFRFLDENTYSAQLDWTTPFSIRSQGDLTVKVGGGVRLRDRVFDATRFDLNRPLGQDPPDGLGILSLPLDRLVTPENIGRNLGWRIVGVGGLPYTSTDDVYNAYGMVDLRPLDRLRLVGGLRVETWQLNVESVGVLDEVRDLTDYLWSANATVELTDAMNLRAAGYQTLSRPDPREVSLTIFNEVTGECVVRGNPEITRSTITNGDLRWEWFPAGGEIVSVSGFYKRFRQPFIQTVGISSLQCIYTPENAESAETYGGELEIRKNLGFLADLLNPFSVVLNYTYTDGYIQPSEDNAIGLDRQPLQDQSEHLANVSLNLDLPNNGLTASILGNYFSDRVRRYGQRVQITSPGDEDSRFRTAPNIIEKSRITLDAKVSKALGDFSVSLSGSNLLDQQLELTQPLPGAEALALLERIGRTFSVSLAWRP